MQKQNNIPPTIIIPAYQPDMHLVELVAAINKQRPKQPIIVVNDGSEKKYDEIFDKLKQYQVEVLQHESNLGKGEALKTAFKHFLSNYHENSIGAVTADADGQHHPKDILNISNALLKNPNALYLGTRNFAKKTIPLRSKLGNILTRTLFNLFSPTKVEDTQTGLRGIPTSLIKEMLTVKACGYEFELEMLFQAIEENLSIKKIRINTIYIDKNTSSHFNPLTDSLKIYFIFIRFIAISISSALIDCAIFFTAYPLLGKIFPAMLIARTISGVINFKLNHKIAFKSCNKLTPSVTKYILLAVSLGFLAYALVVLLVNLGLNIYISKITAEIILFTASFGVQKLFIFNKT